MLTASTRTFLLALGLLVGAFGLISVFTPRGFSWGLECLGLLLALPWVIRRFRGRVKRSPAGGPDVPDWHPESGANPR
jgi:hypothetical protein